MLSVLNSPGEDDAELPEFREPPRILFDAFGVGPGVGGTTQVELSRSVWAVGTCHVVFFKPKSRRLCCSATFSPFGPQAAVDCPKRVRLREFHLGMLPNTSCLLLGILLCAAHAARFTMDDEKEKSDTSQHPHLQLPSSAKVNGQVTTDGAGTWKSGGSVSYKRKLWWLTAVSDHWIQFQEMPKSGAVTRHTTFLGWNNLVNRMVTRYLLVTDYDKQWDELRTDCFTYEEEGPKGYIDPFVEVQEKFWLEAEESGLEQWKTPSMVTSHGTKMLGTMTTETGGKNTVNATLLSTKAGHETIYTVLYSDHVGSAMEDHDKKIYMYKDMNCKTVTNFFDVPEVCVDELLAVEYGCGYAELHHML